MSESPSYFAIIPAHVRYCKELEPSAKLLYGEITSLTNVTGYCWASNEYFANLYEVDERTIQRWLHSLKEQEFIIIDLEKDGLKTNRKIWISKEIREMFTKRQKCHPRGDKNVIVDTTKMPPKEEISFDLKEQTNKGDLFVCFSDSIKEEERAIDLVVESILISYKPSYPTTGLDATSIKSLLGLKCEDGTIPNKDIVEDAIKAAEQYKPENVGAFLNKAIREKWKPKKIVSVDIEENKRFAEDLENKLFSQKNPGKRFVAGNTYAEINFDANMEPIQLDYSEKGFKTRILEFVEVQGWRVKC